MPRGRPRARTFGPCSVSPDGRVRGLLSVLKHLSRQDSRSCPGFGRSGVDRMDVFHETDSLAEVDRFVFLPCLPRSRSLAISWTSQRATPICLARYSVVVWEDRVGSRSCSRAGSLAHSHCCPTKPTEKGLIPESFATMEVQPKPLETKEGTRPWLHILPSCPSFSRSCRDTNSRPRLGGITGAVSCAR